MHQKTKVGSFLAGYGLIDGQVFEDRKVIGCIGGSFDLVLLDQNLKEINKLSGKAGKDFSLQTSGSRSTVPKVFQPQGQTSKYLWLNSPNNLSVVELPKFESKEIPNFWTYNGLKCTAEMVTATSDFKRFAGVGITAENTQTLHIYDAAGGTGFSSTNMTKLFKSRPSLLSEPHLCSRVLFQRHGVVRCRRQRW